MEAMGELAAGGALRWAKLPAVGSAEPLPFRSLRSAPASGGRLENSDSDGGAFGDLAGCLELVSALSSTAAADSSEFDFRQAADFAAGVEEISRTLEYLQVVAAGAVDRTRREAISAARAGSGPAVTWTTGWGNEAAVHGPIGWTTGWGEETAVHGPIG
ncbi:hypothetical protein [Arthrobacter oryzae]|uniref:hypothetical protein n=1 Tax=Arthrobacter oryzae TaxID=409290 RepID=UPI0030C92E41